MNVTLELHFKKIKSEVVGLLSKPAKETFFFFFPFFMFVRFLLLQIPDDMTHSVFRSVRRTDRLILY